MVVITGLSGLSPEVCTMWCPSSPALQRAAGILGWLLEVMIQFRELAAGGCGHRPMCTFSLSLSRRSWFPPTLSRTEVLALAKTLHSEPFSHSPLKPAPHPLHPCISVGSAPLSFFGFWVLDCPLFISFFLFISSLPLKQNLLHFICCSVSLQQGDFQVI